MRNICSILKNIGSAVAAAAASPSGTWAQLLSVHTIVGNIPFKCSANREVQSEKYYYHTVRTARTHDGDDDDDDDTKYIELHWVGWDDTVALAANWGLGMTRMVGVVEWWWWVDEKHWLINSHGFTLRHSQSSLWSI